MISQEQLLIILPWVMSFFSITALWLAGRKYKYTWYFYIFAELIWTIWIFAAGQWGFLPMNLFTIAICLRNQFIWKKS